MVASGSLLACQSDSPSRRDLDGVIPLRSVGISGGTRLGLILRLLRFFRHRPRDNDQEPGCRGHAHTQHQ